MQLTCPNCGRESTFTWSEHTATEPHGETHHDECATCDLCGAATDAGELALANEEPMEVIQ